MFSHRGTTIGIALTLAFALLSFLPAQQVNADDTPILLWQQVYPSLPQGSVEAYSDRIIVGGRTASNESGLYQAAIARLDGKGALMWSKTYGYKSDSYCNIFHSVKQTPDGGLIAAGAAIGGIAEPFLVKTDSNGAQEWEKAGLEAWGMKGTNAYGSLYDVAIVEGGYLLTGGLVRTGKIHVWIAKISATGGIIWQKEFLRDSHLGAHIEQTRDGGFFILAQRSGVTHQEDINILAIKTDSAGNVTWERGIGSRTWWDYLGGGQQTSDGGYIVSGTRGSVGGDGKAYYYLSKLDASGRIVWEKCFEAEPGDISCCHNVGVQETEDKGYVLSGTVTIGRTSGPDPYRSYIYIVKVDADGKKSWQIMQAGDKKAEKYTLGGGTLSLISDGSFLVSGTMGIEGNNSDTFIWKFSKWRSGASTFYFAEGTTRPNFDPYICIQNPGDTDAKVTITYMKGDGSKDTQDVTVKKNSRSTVRCKDKLGEANDSAHDFSSKVECTNGQSIIAERPMYFNYNGVWTGGHDVIGATSPSSTFYFAEGTTRDNFNEWLCLQNPGNADAHATITYYTTSGQAIDKPWTIPANSRLTVNVNTDAGANQDISAKVTSDKPIIVERPMYFDYNGWTGGHDVVGF